MTTTKIAAPDGAAVSLAAAKLICKVEHELEDSLIETYVASATRMAEARMQRPIIDTTYEMVTDAFGRGTLALDHPRSRVKWVSYIDPEGVERYLDPQDYLVDNTSEVDFTFLGPAPGKRWPSTRRQMNAVRVRYVAGFGASATDVPKDIATWVLVHVRALYNECDLADLSATHCMLADYVVHGG